MIQQQLATYNIDQRRSEIAGRIREARSQCGLTQEQVAARLGCSRIRLNRVEKGKTNLTVVEMDLLARTLNLPVSYFFSMDGSLTQRVVWSVE